MAINKVIYGNDTLIDLTSDTVSANNLLNGETAHDRSGTVIQGTVTVPDDLNDLSDVDISSPTDGQALLYDDTIDKWVNGDIQITESQVTNLITDLSNKVGKFKLTNERLSDVTTEGFYYAETNNTCNDKPSDCSSGEAFGLLVVKVGNSDFYQIYFRNNTFNSGYMYKRSGSTSSIFAYPWTRMYFSNTHRPINVNGTELLGNNSTAVNFIDGTNTTVVGSGSDIQINATDIDKVDWVSNGILGAKNLNSTPYYHNSRTINSVVWTVNADGSVTANGKATGGNSNFACHSRNMEAGKLVLPNGNYILSGCATDGSSSTWEIAIERTHNGSAETIAINQSGDTKFTLNGDDYSADSVQVQLILRVRNNQQANNITFYPMIRLVNDTDATWRPYAPTNRDLQVTKPNPEAIATVEYSPTRANHSQGDLIMFNGNLYKCLSAITNGDNLVVGTNIQQTDLVTEILAMISAL